VTDVFDILSHLDNRKQAAYASEISAYA